MIKGLPVLIRVISAAISSDLAGTRGDVGIGFAFAIGYYQLSCKCSFQFETAILAAPDGLNRFRPRFGSIDGAG